MTAPTTSRSVEFELSDGQRVTLPATYADGEVTIATFPARMGRIRELLPRPGLRPLALAPGVGALAVACYEWRESPIGPYIEVGLGVPLRGGSAPELARWLLRGDAILPLSAALWQFPVTTEIAARSGRELYGFPKWVGGVTLERSGRSLRCVVARGDERLLTLEAHRPRRRGRRRVRFSSQLRHDGEPQSCSFDVAAADAGFSAGPRGRARIDLGDHPLARQLASVLLTRRAVAVIALDDVSGTLSPPDRVTPSVRRSAVSEFR